MSNSKSDDRVQHIRHPTTLLREVGGNDMEMNVEGVVSSTSLSPPNGFAEHLCRFRDVIICNNSAARFEVTMKRDVSQLMT